ncbi:MAG: ABC transporter permease [Actinomycetota bacterium]
MTTTVHPEPTLTQTQSDNSRNEHPMTMTHAIAETETLPHPVETTTEPIRRSERDPGVGFGRLIHAEWFKFRTVRSNMLAVVGAGGAAVSLGMLFASLAETGEGPGRLANDGLSLSLGGFNLSQIIIAILGVAIVASEYQSGLIRSWFAAAPSRLQVLGAKVGVYTAVAFVSTAVAATVAFLAGQAVMPESIAMSLTDDGVIQALAGTAFYAACIGAIGVALGFLLRSTAAGAGVVVSTLLIAPLMVSLLPSSIGDPIADILPSNASAAVTGMGAVGQEVMSTGAGIAVLLGWVVASVTAAAVVVRRRDA